MQTVWEKYLYWYKNKFGKTPNETQIIIIKKYNIETRYNTLINAIFKQIVERKSELYFEKYLDYIFDEWKNAKKNLDMFPKWLGSPIMIRNYLEACDIILNRDSNTYSNHAAVGKGEDGEFDATNMFR